MNEENKEKILQKLDEFKQQAQKIKKEDPIRYIVLLREYERLLKEASVHLDETTEMLREAIAKKKNK